MAYNPLSHNSLEIILLSTLVACLVAGCGSAHHSIYTYGPSIIRSNSTCPREFYKVVFDAGSTGSRLFVFQFRVGKKGTVIKLNNEYFWAVEPGISSYAKDISGVSSSLKPLLHHAMQKVPKIYQNSTMLTFKATAGLRLLPDEVADDILDEVRSLLKKSPFYIPDLNRVEVMSGGEEGLFGWVTANFLLGKLWKHKKEETVIAIDLGGGSVQITFELPPNVDIETVCSGEIGEVFKLHLLKSSFNVYTNSALGNGLKSAYLNIMGGQEEIENDEEESEKQETAKKLHLFSPCFVPDFETTWEHGRYNYTILGEEPEVSMLVDCQQRVEEFVIMSDLAKVVQQKHQDIYLFSYFFDVARWGGIIPLEKGSMRITVSEYHEAARYYCQDSKFSVQEPFVCMSLLYVHSLLSTGFGMPDSTSIYVANEINGKQLSWVLGSALASFNEQLSYSSLCDAL